MWSHEMGAIWRANYQPSGNRSMHKVRRGKIYDEEKKKRI